MKLKFTNGFDEVEVKVGYEIYPILFIFPITYLIGGIIAFRKKQFNIAVINTLMIFMFACFITALVFSFTTAGQSGVYDASLVYENKAAIATMSFLFLIYIITILKYMMHISQYQINALVKRGYSLVDMSEENIKVVEHAAKYKKPFWTID